MFFFLAYFTLYNQLQFHPSHQNWFKCILFNSWVIIHCVYVPQLSYPFICWWTSRLLPCPGYYKQCCDEHWGTCISEGEGGMISENGIETCILSCKKRIASLCSMQDTGCLGLVHGEDPEGWCGGRWEGGSGLGTHVHPWWIHVNLWQNQYSIVK